MSEGLHLTVLTPERAVIDEPVYSVTAPGAAGYLGILQNHAPLITSLVPGKLTVKNLQQQPTVYCIGGGFLEVASNKVIVLADTLEEIEDIDMADAMEALKWAERRLHDATTELDREQAQLDVDRARNRVLVKRNPGPSV